MSAQRTTREVRLRRRHDAEPLLSDFEIVETPVPSLALGEVLVRNTWMLVDPYMRGGMDDAPSYMPPFTLGAVLEGSALGEVIASRDDAMPIGTTVVHFAGWRDVSVVPSDQATIVDLELAPAETWLGPLGTTGLTAWLAMSEVARVQPGDVVFI